MQSAHIPSHGLWWKAVLEVRKVKVAPSVQMRLEKVLTASGAKYPLAHVVTRQFTLAAGASMAKVDALFLPSSLLAW